MKQPRRQKITTDHHVLREFWKTLTAIEKITRIKKIIPGRIYVKKSSTAKPLLSLSTLTTSGPKYMMKYQSRVQELFIVCDQSAINHVLYMIDAIVKIELKP